MTTIENSENIGVVPAPHSREEFDAAWRSSWEIDWSEARRTGYLINPKTGVSERELDEACLPDDGHSFADYVFDPEVLGLHFKREYYSEEPEQSEESSYGYSS